MLEHDIWRTISKRVTGEELIGQLRVCGARLLVRQGVLVHRHGSRVIFSHGPLPASAEAFALPPESASVLERGAPGPIAGFHVHLVPSRNAPVPAEALGAWWLRLADVLEAAIAAGFHAEKSARNVVRVHRPSPPFRTRAEIMRMRLSGLPADLGVADAGAEMMRLRELGACRLGRVGAWSPDGGLVVGIAAYDDRDRILCLAGAPLLTVLIADARAAHGVVLTDDGLTLKRHMSSVSSQRLSLRAEAFDEYRWTLP